MCSRQNLMSTPSPEVIGTIHCDFGRNRRSPPKSSSNHSNHIYRTLHISITSRSCLNCDKDGAERVRRFIYVCMSLSRCAGRIDLRQSSIMHLPPSAIATNHVLNSNSKQIRSLSPHPRNYFPACVLLKHLSRPFEPSICIMCPVATRNNPQKRTLIASRRFRDCRMRSFYIQKTT